MTRLTAGHIVRLPEGGLGSSGLALVTKATTKAVTVTTGSLELMYEPEKVTKVGYVFVTRSYQTVAGRRFRLVFVVIGDIEHRFDIAVREPGQPEITAVGDIRKLAFARWLEVKS